MTKKEREFAAQKEPARAEADRVITLKNVEEASLHMKNLGLEIAKAMLRCWGWYSYNAVHKDGTREKVFIEVAA